MSTDGLEKIVTPTPQMQPPHHTSAIAYFDESATEYDKRVLSPLVSWLGPDVTFGLTFPYVSPNQRLLDIGIGTGLSSSNFYRLGLEIHGIDGSQCMLHECRKKGITASTSQLDISTEAPFPFPDNFFDVTISDATFYFLKDLNHPFKETRRVLKTGGIFTFSIEELEGNEHISYIPDEDGKIISEPILEKTGVKVYRHDSQDVEKLLRRYDFEVLKRLNYLAYISPSISKDIHLTALVARKK